MIKELKIPTCLSGIRMDDALASLAEISKGEARRIIDRGGCALNRSMVRVASRKVQEGDCLTVGIMQPGEFRNLVLEPSALVYQDDNLLAVNKPTGVASQRTPYQLKGTLEYWVSEEFARQGIQEPVRVVHRLDRGTSGLMLFPRHRQSAAWLSQLFRDGQIIKHYLALVSGNPAHEAWSADGPIAKVGPARWGVLPEGRPARTDFRLLASGDKMSLLEAQPVTGRTHQIRVHLAADNLPITGDKTYGGADAVRLMLHCIRLEFRAKNGRILKLEAAPGQDFRAVCEASGIDQK